MRRSMVWVGMAVWLAAVSAGAQEHWPQFRGPDGDGIAENGALPVQWSATENVAWKTDIPGRGWSSPIVWGDRVFLTTAVALGKVEAAKKGLYFGGERKKTPPAHQWKVFCLDLEDGAILWERQVHEDIPFSAVHVKNSLASETPVTDGERIYAYFGNVGVFCLEFDGNVVWEKRLEPHRMRVSWGTGASPVLHQDRLYILNDNDDDASYLLALDKTTGEEVWRVDRVEDSNWSTPFVWEHAQRTEIVTVGSDQVRSYDLDGELLWWFEGMSAITIGTPYAHEGLLIVSSGYVGDRDRPLYAIRPGATGDITLAEDATSNEWIAWSHPQAAPYNPTTLGYGGRIYVLHDAGRMACYNAADGAVLYEKERIPEGRRFTASPWAYDDKIFCLNEDGVTFVMQAGDSFEHLETNPLQEDDMGMASPAMAGDRLLIRTEPRIYCIKKTAG